MPFRQLVDAYRQFLNTLTIQHLIFAQFSLNITIEVVLTAFQTTFDVGFKSSSCALLNCIIRLLQTF